MAVPTSSLGVDIGKKAVALAITVLVLWIVHVIAASLPMLQHAPLLGGTGIWPLSLTLAIIDTVILVALIQFGMGAGSLLRRAYPSFPDLGLIVNLVMITIVMSLAYKAYDGVLLPLFGGGPSVPRNELGPLANAYMQAWQQWAQTYGGASLPTPFAIDEHALKIYDAVFLVLVAAPLIGVVVLLLRNMNTISGLVFHSGVAVAGSLRGTPTAACTKCGAGIAAGVGFCPHCGTPVAGASASPAAAPALPHCPTCGAEHGASAKFCRQCGGALIAAK